MRRRPLSHIQRQIVEAILRSRVERGFPPTVRELAEAIGLSSPATVHHHLDALERMGWITREPNRPRTVVVVDPPEENDDHPLEDLHQPGPGGPGAAP